MVIVLLAGVLLTAFGVMGWVFYQMHRAALLAQESLAVPVESLEAVQSLRHAQDQPSFPQSDGKGASPSLPAVGVVLTAAVQRDDQVQHWRAENAAFQVRLQESDGDIQRLKDVLSRVEEENLRLKAEIDGLTGTKGLVQEVKRDYQCRLESFFKEIDELNEDNSRLKGLVADMAEVPQLRQALDELSARTRELEILHAAQSEKSEYLQYELTKSRAQVVGLERLCEKSSVSG